MPKRLIALVVGVAAVVVSLSRIIGGQVLPWNNAGMAQGQNQLQTGPAAPAPRRDLTGIWDAGGAGIGARGATPAPLTPWGEALGKTHKAGDGIRQSPIEEINDPLSTMGDPEGFPRNLLFELRPFQIVHTPNSVLFLYMFEKRWRVVWTDGRQLPKDPDPRWYGYSVGRWEDDSTFVVDSNGTDERTWLDNAGNPHSSEMKVEERYHRVNGNTLELTVTLDDPKAYTKPWVARNKLPLRLMPPNTDLMEMIPSATEAAAYKKVFAAPGK
jgi:hypothetical protein